MNKKFVIAAGGTGGHIFPAIILGEYLLSLGFGVLFITDSRFHNYKYDAFEKTLQHNSFKLFTLKSGAFSGNFLKKVKNIILFGADIIRLAFLCTKKDKFIVFGGYPSMPACFIAFIKKSSLILHEQNSVLGRVNRLWQTYSSIIITGFQECFGVLSKNLHKVRHLGTPIIQKPLREKDPNRLSKPGYKVKVLVLGGSQGSKLLSIPVCSILCSISNTVSIEVTHQCHAGDVDLVQKEYSKHNVKALTSAFFQDVPTIMQQSDIIISRAGAGTISEIIYYQVPAILIPLKIAKDNHQHYNALQLEKIDAARIIHEDDLETSLQPTLQDIFCNKNEKLKEMEKSLASKSLHNQNCVKQIANTVIE